MLFRCIQCFSEYDGINKTGDYYCPSCGVQFKRIYNIPVFVTDPDDYVAKKILFCENSIRELEKDLLDDENILATTNPERYERINNAALFQINTLKEIQNILLKDCSFPSVLKNIGKSQSLGYGVTFEYLIRDWSFLEECENEIAVIKQAVFSKIKGKRKRALILGAGLGRIAIEMLDTFSEVYAIDLSIEMPFLFNKLITENDIRFNYFFKKNVVNDDSLFLDVHIESTYICQKLSDNRHSIFQYLVADAANLPFTDGSFDAIISCYFTDVVPLNSIINELSRVLKTGGSFIHFGPLDFHFSDISQMLTLAEIADRFKEANYQVSISDPVLQEHIALPNKFNKKVYLNQLFLAIKLNNNGQKKISGKDVLRLNAPLSFSLSGVLSETGIVQYGNAELKIKGDKTYDGALGVFEVIKCFDGKKQLSQIIRELSAIYHIDKETKKKIMTILADLLATNVLGRASV